MSLGLKSPALAHLQTRRDTWFWSRLVPFQLFRIPNDAMQNPIDVPIRQRVVRPNDWNGTRESDGS